ncbi:MAG: hypothetical protein ACFFC3_11615 [Candidatus Odinarchaeota archaeon]
MVLFEQITTNLLSIEFVFKDLIGGLENWCLAFNKFFLIFCRYLKYIFVFIILIIGIFTLFKLGRNYDHPKSVTMENKENFPKKSRLILGCCYIVLGIGFLFNYFIYFLIIILDPLPDRLIYNFITFSGIDPFYLNGIRDISASQFPHEKTIYYCFSFISLISILDILLSLWYLISCNRITHNPRRTIIFLISGIIGGILFGFNTFLPFFL